MSLLIEIDCMTFSIPFIPYVVEVENIKCGHMTPVAKVDSWTFWACRCQCPLAPAPISSSNPPPHTPRRSRLVPLYAMATPGKPRQSAIPGPLSRSSSIPTPGRPRSASSVYQPVPASSSTSNEMSRAFEDAIKANDPAQHRFNSALSTSASLSPKSASILQSGRRSVAGRPSSVASSSSALSASTRAGAKTPSSVSTRPSSRAQSRQSDALHTTVTANKSSSRTFLVGDNVRIESLGYEGVLRYLGEIEGKPGQWAGVQLGGGFAGKGKNDGSVGGYVSLLCSFQRIFI